MSETETPVSETPKAKTPGVGAVAIELIRGGKTNEEVLAAVREQFPEAKTSMSSINWYRNKLRSEGESVKTARELKKAAAPAEGVEKPKRVRKKKAAEAEAAPQGEPAVEGGESILD